MEHLDSVKRTIKKLKSPDPVQVNRIWLLWSPHTQGYNVLHFLAEAEQACPPALQDTGGHTGILRDRA